MMGIQENMTLLAHVGEKALNPGMRASSAELEAIKMAEAAMQRDLEKKIYETFQPSSTVQGKPQIKEAKS